MAQLWQTSLSKNWKSRFFSMSQKSKIVFDFFPIIYILIKHLSSVLLTLMDQLDYLFLSNINCKTRNTFKSTLIYVHWTLFIDLSISLVRSGSAMYAGKSRNGRGTNFQHLCVGTRMKLTPKINSRSTLHDFDLVMGFCI